MRRTAGTSFASGFLPKYYGHVKNSGGGGGCFTALSPPRTPMLICNPHECVGKFVCVRELF